MAIETNITEGMQAIDHHSHASAAKFRSLDDIDRLFGTAHLESNVPSEIYQKFISARNKNDLSTLDQLQKDYKTGDLLQRGIEFRTTTFFSRALSNGYKWLYGCTEDRESMLAAAENWRARGPTYSYDRALEKANTPIVLTDVPYLDRDIWNPTRYYQIVRIDPYLYPLHSGEGSGRGTEFQRFHGVFAAVLQKELAHYGMETPPEDFEKYVDFIDKSLERRLSEGAIGIKLASAYVRSIQIDEATHEEAAHTYRSLMAGKPTPRKKLEDYLIHRISKFAANRQIPLQIHVGMGHPEPGMVIRNSEPFNLEGFLNTPSLNRLKIILLHGGYPFSSELSALCQTYGNVFLDFSWMPYLHHNFLRNKLIEWMEILPANKVVYGSDTGSPEFHVAASTYARESLNYVLLDGYRRGVWSIKQVEWLAQRILFQNTADIYESTLNLTHCR